MRSDVIGKHLVPKGTVVYSGRTSGNKGINAEYKSLDTCEFFWVGDRDTAGGYALESAIKGGLVEKYVFESDTEFPLLPPGEQVFYDEGESSSDIEDIRRSGIPGYYTDHTSGRFEICIYEPRKYLKPA